MERRAQCSRRIPPAARARREPRPPGFFERTVARIHIRFSTFFGIIFRERRRCGAQSGCDPRLHGRSSIIFKKKSPLWERAKKNASRKARMVISDCSRRGGGSSHATHARSRSGRSRERCDSPAGRSMDSSPHRDAIGKVNERSARSEAPFGSGRGCCRSRGCRDVGASVTGLSHRLTGFARGG